MSATTRWLDADDWRLWRAIRLRALADSPTAFASTLEREQAYDEQDWRGHFATSAIVIVEAGGKPVACAAVSPFRDGFAGIFSMWVDPAHRGTGISTLILDELVAWAHERGLGVELGVATENASAKAAYLAYGFVPTGHTFLMREGSDDTGEVFALPSVPTRE